MILNRIIRVPRGNGFRKEAGTVLKTHSKIPYSDGVRRIYLYVGGKLQKDAGDDDKKLQDLLWYIGKSTSENVVDEKIEMLDNIVRKTKADRNVGVRYMKSWEWEREIREEGREEAREQTEAERKRADEAETRAKLAEAELAKYKAKFGDIA